MTASTLKPILESLPPSVRSDVLARFDLLIDRSGGPDACWPYTKATVAGYGSLWVPTPDGGRRMVKTHRLAFEAAHGHTDETVDHLCHDHESCPGGPKCPHRRCCNPTHLAAATSAANARRSQLGRKKETCAAGHELTDENTYHSPFGGRRCRQCAAEQAAARRAEAAKARPPRERRRRYRPRGMNLEQTAAWLLDTAHREPDGCIIPDVHVVGSGYRGVSVGGRSVSAHRLVFEVKRGPIPDGMVVDHTCHDPATCEGGLTCPHRSCINPDHLALATYAENVAEARASRVKATHCGKGHEFTEANTYVDNRGSRHCRACQSERSTNAGRKAVDGRARVDGKCKAGRHDITVTGLTPEGKCRACKQEAQRRYKARKAATV